MNYGDINSVQYLPIDQPVSVDAQRTPDGFARYLTRSSMLLDTPTLKLEYKNLELRGMRMKSNDCT